ncbi:MAG: 1-acyl-sn-glycerol-3-phosphate acyltransferase [Bacteroides sp.]|nr:1-acyl-sn-glycerol-3-phosphate acyltransferase [Bacteroides sp.]MCM1379268.1 1-acyl-sn-glycerol-3-phosphate acyltransferase [Bacteroides sp.]MCM1445074.1 1-acyl-sn-glycerol-3-phosphate acyltransferase [Prevotella sp.]
MTDQDFKDIAPFSDGPEFHDHIARLVGEPLFKHAVTYVMPGVDYDAFCRKLLECHTRKDFQFNIMLGFLEMLEKTTSKGITINGIDNYEPEKRYVLISNHRDIVLDAAFLNLGLVRGGRPTCEVAIGNNLLIMPWIDELVRINNSFIVKRDTGVRGALEAAKHLSAYIHYCINEKHDSLWIAHREGRAKDSNDRTQEALIKMLTLGGSGSAIENIKAVNLLPVSISYEYDPNDYLKAKEFLCKRRDPEFKKSQRDDLLSMETGILKQKGRIHFALTECINPELDALPEGLNRTEACQKVCEIVDRHIHRNYRLYPINYVAYDLLNGTHRFADQYTEQDVNDVNERISKQLSKVDLPDITPEEMNFMRQMVLTMYANPLSNKLCASL